MSVRFACPKCNSALSAPDHRIGTKTNCPKCGQRLLVPGRPANRTVLGRPIEEGTRAARSPARAPESQPGTACVTCPGCGRAIVLPLEELSQLIECAKCLTRFVPSGGAARQSPPQHYDEPPPERKHSGLGIASFLIALLVGGLDLILAIVIATGVAKSAPSGMRTEIVGGGLALICFNFLSLPLCLVGFGMGLVALVVNRDRGQAFSWLGLFGNGVVVFGLIAFYFITQATGH